MAQVIQNTGHDDMIVSLPLSRATQNYLSKEFAPERTAQASARSWFQWRLEAIHNSIANV
jgi:hypothetical protein